MSQAREWKCEEKVPGKFRQVLSHVPGVDEWQLQPRVWQGQKEVSGRECRGLEEWGSRGALPGQAGDAGGFQSGSE